MWLENLVEMKKNSGLTTEEISKRSGIPRGTLNKLFAGQTQNPQLETMRALVHTLGYTLDDLEKIVPAVPLESWAEALVSRYNSLDENGRGAVDVILTYEMDRMLREKIQAEKRTLPIMSGNALLVDLSSFNYSNQPVSAGTGVYLGEESMSTMTVKAKVLPNTHCFGVPVSGDSMEPIYHDGDMLIVSKEPVNVGEIGVFTMEGEGYVKKLGRGVLYSLNQKYEPIPLTENVICNGKVVGVLSSDDILE